MFEARSAQCADPRLTPAGYAVSGPSAQLEIPRQFDHLSSSLTRVEEFASQLSERLRPAIAEPRTAQNAAGGPSPAGGANGCGIAGTVETLAVRAQHVGDLLAYMLENLQF